MCIYDALHHQKPNETQEIGSWLVKYSVFLGWRVKRLLIHVDSSCFSIDIILVRVVLVICPLVGYTLFATNNQI